MLTGLKVFSSACKCVFYRIEHYTKGGSHELSFDGHKMQKWNTPTDWAQRVDEKNGLIMFTPEVMVIKMSKMAHYSILFANPVGVFLVFYPLKAI